MGRIKVWAGVLLLAPCMGCVSLEPDRGTGAINFSRREGTSSISSRQQDKDVEPPPGFVDFCRRSANQCRDSKTDAERITLTEDALQTLRLVNMAINRSIRPEDDREHYGREEYWTIPVDG